MRWNLIRRPPNRACMPLCSRGVDLPILQLETAKEILCEVFDTSSSEVEEMIRQRLAEQEDL